MVYNFSFQDGAQFIYIVQQPNRKGKCYFKKAYFVMKLKEKIHVLRMKFIHKNLNNI